MFLNGIFVYSSKIQKNSWREYQCRAENAPDSKQKNDLLHSTTASHKVLMELRSKQAGNVAWDEMNPRFISFLEISFIGRQKNKSFEYDWMCPNVHFNAVT